MKEFLELCVRQLKKLVANPPFTAAHSNSSLLHITLYANKGDLNSSFLDSCPIYTNCFLHSLAMEEERRRMGTYRPTLFTNKKVL